MTDRHQRMTARLMARFGGAATLSRTELPGDPPQNPFPDPNNPDPAPEPVTTTWAVTIIEQGVELDHQPDSSVRAGDLVAAMQPHPDVTPTQADDLIVGGITYAVLSVQPIRSNPDGPVIHYVLHGRA